MHRPWVQLRHVDLGAPGWDLSRLGGILSPDEHDRAARFHFESDRRRFVICRACLRLTISNHLSVPAKSIDFAYGRYGKPYLAGASVAFNISHSGDAGLIAISSESEVGVDIEWMRPGVDLDGIERYFSPPEQTWLHSAGPTNAERAFFEQWTCKEALMKASGLGVHLPLHSFSIAPPKSPTGFRAVNWEPDGTEAPYWAWNTPAPLGYAAAVAVRQPDRSESLTVVTVSEDSELARLLD